jgi:hypothetical protein
MSFDRVCFALPLGYLILIEGLGIGETLTGSKSSVGLASSGIERRLAGETHVTLKFRPVVVVPIVLAGRSSIPSLSYNFTAFFVVASCVYTAIGEDQPFPGF